MARTSRTIHAGVCYHLINRGNNRATLFHHPADYAAFVGLIRAAQQRVTLDLLAACLMPNHFHLVVRPKCGGDVARWMHWLLTTHAHRHNLAYGVTGHVWQGRYRAFPIEQDEHLLAVVRYVERNAVRAGLVRRARDWKWSSAAWRIGPTHRSRMLAELPVDLPSGWVDYVDQPQTAEETAALRSCVNGQKPYGAAGWQRDAAECHGFNGSPRHRGRPRGKMESVPN